MFKCKLDSRQNIKGRLFELLGMIAFLAVIILIGIGVSYLVSLTPWPKSIAVSVVIVFMCLSILFCTYRLFSWLLCANHDGRVNGDG